MEDDFKNYVVLDKEEYNQLLQTKTKYNQYKKYILNNTQNNHLVKAMTTIEGRNLYDLIQENMEEE